MNKESGNNTSTSPSKEMIPRLRFPEFKGLWRTEQLSNLLDYERPDNYIVNDTNYISEGTPVLTANKSFILGYTQETFGICEDIPAIIFDDFTVDKKFVDFPFKVKSSAIKILRPKGKTNLKFIFELMSLIRFEAKEHKRYYISVYQNLIVPIPKPTEQQKIAACLSSLDEVIKAESQKLEVLKKHKKGLLQNLFPREGETLPKFRFKEFENHGEWELKALGELVDVLMCKRIFAEETNENSGVPFFKIGTLGGNPDAFISRELFEEYKFKYNYPRKGEVLVTCSGTVGKCLIYDGQDAYYQDSNIVWLGNEMLQVSNELLFHILSNVNWNILNSTTITRIYGADLRGLKIQYPKVKEEQDMIATCLSSCDRLISEKFSEVEELKHHKMGLLQSLFP